ncbi:MAG: proline racemase family protein [Candidatus Acidiferrales bacterium]
MSLTKPRVENSPANMFDAVERIHIVDSHTGGEPTRIVVSGAPDLGGGSVADQMARFRLDHDYLRSALANEPRSSEVVVGGILCKPNDPTSAAGVVFFNNVGYLGMCVHGTIGLVTTLAYLGKITYGDHRVETPVGTVTATLHETGEVTVVNVASKRTATDVTVQVPNYGAVTGDVAWGGNWFFLVNNNPVELNSSNIEKLTEFTWAIRQALATNGITGSDGKEIDHVELFSPSRKPGIQSQNFVLCPGKAYDRSPCGTGTSAKLACLYADGKLKPGEVWRQESIVGSVFEGQVRIEDGQVLPIIKGSAFITSEADVILDPRDPFRNGIYP